MDLNRVIFTNFRSIKDQTIYFEPRCRILVGINESGKSNILRGLSFLSKEIIPESDDLREESHEEDLIHESSVLFVFSLNNEDRVRIYENIKSIILCDNFNKPIIRIDDNALTLAQFCNTLEEGLYEIDVESKKKHGSYWTFPNEHEILQGWCKPSQDLPTETTTDTATETSAAPVDFKSFSIIDNDFQADIPQDKITSITIEDLHFLVGTAIANYVKINLPNCVVWNYDEAYLLPAKLDINSFCNDPNVCIPLKRMFNLSGYNDIGKQIQEAKEHPNKMINMLERVAKITTDHIKEIWPEYGNIKIDLRENSNHIEATIRDVHNHYNFARRSDGFKRFVSFLLMISASNKTKELNNVLLIHDEPDISLHPSGIRHLLKEMIKISKNNYVVLSTHSIYMIDNDNIGRHIIVKKQDEVTTLTEADVSNIVDEEVLYNSLRVSVFDIIKKFNIIFEGWRDKHLFRTAISKYPKGMTTVKKKFSNIGICHAQGVKDVSRIYSTLELAQRKYMVISDSDKVAHEYQAKFEGDGKWLRYDQLLPSFNSVTVEDFIKQDFIEQILRDIIRTDPRFTNSPIPSWNSDVQRLNQIKAWLHSLGFNEPGIKEFLENYKKMLFQNIKNSNVRNEYYEMLKNLSDNIESN